METCLAPVRKTVINPWALQDSIASARSAEVPFSAATLYCSGKEMPKEEGSASGGNMREEIHNAFDKLEVVLHSRGYTLCDVVRLNFYTTSVDAFLDEYEIVLKRLKNFNCVPSSTLTEVRTLASPSLMLEIEATAAR
ncbi:MAG: hypothetical protein KF862_01365 [Chitinophagaceae bacterium]|nr:hypothetical protein [Chitinophagaceae bacterium]